MAKSSTNFLNVVRSEWIKLKSTKALWWTSALIMIFAFGFTALAGLVTGATLEGMDPAEEPEVYAAMVRTLTNSAALGGFLFFGMMVVLIQGAMAVTGEYSSSTSKTTLLGTPKRWLVPLAKLVVSGLIAAVTAFIAAAGSIVVYRLCLASRLSDDSILDGVGLGADGAWTMVGRSVLYAVLATALAIGVGYLMRHTAGAISVLLLWVLVVENTLVQLVPKVNEILPQWMPFKNMENAASLMDTTDAPWGQVGSMLYFAAFAIVLFVAGVVSLAKRDA